MSLAIHAALRLLFQFFCFKKVHPGLPGYAISPQLWGEGFVLRGFLKWAALPPKPSEAQVQGWFLLLTKRPGLGFVSVLLVFCGVRAVDVLRFRLFYFLIIFIYINKLLYFFMN